MTRTTTVRSLLARVSITEKIIFSIFALLFIATSYFLIQQYTDKQLTEVPQFGGTLSESVIGTPRFANPLLAVSEADRDITELVYSGLTKIAPDGSLVPDLANSYTISEDKLTYTFTLRDDITFHDGEKLTSDDIVFTITKVQDQDIKSPRLSNWDGVIIEKIDDRTVAFILDQPYAPFLNNTTLGILPEHLWSNVSIEEFPFTALNRQPIGSGPYRISEITTNDSGIPTQYTLEAFDNYSLGRPNIAFVTFNFYTNEATMISAFNEGQINTINGINPSNISTLNRDMHEISRFPLPRIFGVFFNQSNAPVLASSDVRKALSVAIDRRALINNVLDGYARETTGPIPPNVFMFTESIESATNEATEDKITTDEATDTDAIELNTEVQEDVDFQAMASELLSDAGWEKNDDGILAKGSDDERQLLTFDITTVNIPELVRVAESIIATWKSLGVDVSLEVYEPSDLNQSIIRPRNYDALLFGEVIGRDFDFYAFWHSSQRSDPGLNIADYANIDVDKALEQARLTSNIEELQEHLSVFTTEVEKDTPAAFIYSPDFIYVTPKELKGITNRTIIIPSDRFANIHEWYIKTERVWKLFE